MPHIRINTEHVREAGRQLSSESARLAEAGHALQQAIGSLDVGAWDGVSRGRAEPLLGQVTPHSQRLAEELQGLTRQLARVADVFEHEDANASRSLEGMAWVNWDTRGGVMSPPPPDGNPRIGRIRYTEGSEYTPIEGQPFVLGAGDGSDIHPSDVTQGLVGDCYMLAPLAAIAQRDPERIRRMVRDNGDGTYTVTLYERQLWESEYSPVDVVVTSEFPVLGEGPVFARVGDNVDGNPELWTMLVEKAYAQHRGGYQRIHGGWSHAAIEHLTGVESDTTTTTFLNFDTLAQYNEQGYALTTTSLRGVQIGDRERPILNIPDLSDYHPLYQDETLVANHEYYITGVDRAAQTVTVRNPWGWDRGEVTLPFEEFRGAFRGITFIPLSPDQGGE
jgi:WXG100 family type VII secretion target